MARGVDVEGWIWVVGAAGLGLAGAWAVDSHLLGENASRAAVYTLIVFGVVATGLRSQWRRRHFWRDLLVLLVLHTAVVLPLVRELDFRSVRLNWLIALPFALVEVPLALGVLWRRNVTRAGHPSGRRRSGGPR